MTDASKLSAEQKAAIRAEAKSRMVGRARSWLQDSKVKAALKAKAYPASVCTLPKAS